MTRSQTIRLATLALFGLLWGGNSAEAGWIILANNTSQVLVVQDAPENGTLPRRVKSVRLLPGEVYREFQPGEGKKTVVVFDIQHPGAPLIRGHIHWTAENCKHSIEPDGSTIRFGPIPTSAAKR